MQELRYWPDDFPQPDGITAEEQREFGFLKRAFSEGHEAFADPLALGASSKDGRVGDIIRRGGKGRYWEVILSERKMTIKSFFVDGFDSASVAVLSWLRGDDCLVAISQIEQAIVSKPGERGW